MVLEAGVYIPHPHRLVARRGAPSGLHAHENTRPSCPSSLASSRPVSTSHTRTVLSLDEEASRRPSGRHAHECTLKRCPCSAAASRGAASPTCHTRTGLSSDAEASLEASGLHAQQRTPLVCPRSSLSPAPTRPMPRRPPSRAGQAGCATRATYRSTLAASDPRARRAAAGGCCGLRRFKSERNTSGST